MANASTPAAPYSNPARFLSEFVGTALLVAIGLSTVIALWGKGAPLADIPLTLPERRMLNGLLFGTTGALISISPVGRISGSHINPAMTLAFWLEGKLKTPTALGYVVAQITGGIVGAICLLAWGPTGASDSYGASLPDEKLPIWIPCLGEVLCGFSLVTLVFVVSSHASIRKWTPWVNPPLFALLNLIEAPASGDSANPARSIGPALVAGQWQGQWIYLVGPCTGAAIAVGLLGLHLFGQHHPVQAKVAHFTLPANPKASPA
jgi:aquaporin Z